MTQTLFCCLLLLAQAASPRKFDPDKDRPAIKNISDASVPLAHLGSCDGAGTWTEFYWRARGRDNSIPSLAKAWADLEKANGAAYMAKVSAYLQHVATVAGRHEFGSLSRRVLATLDDARASIKTQLESEGLVGMGLADESMSVGHRVEIYDQYKLEDGNLVYKVADPNYGPGHKFSKKVILYYDFKERAWLLRSPDGVVGRYPHGAPLSTPNKFAIEFWMLWQMVEEGRPLKEIRQKMQIQELPPAKTTWSAPQGPGGIALDPNLALPELGQVKRLSVDWERWEVVLETSGGPTPIESVDPVRLAQILRMAAAGEVPFITIGSERSDRVGYAKVTYAPSLVDTLAGAILYRADIQFKAIFAGYPLGRAGKLNRPGDLVYGFPGGGGDFTRFWITSSDIQLEQREGRLVTLRHGMQIRSETTIVGEVVSDADMETYVARLTSCWDALAAEIPEFRAVQAMALETALAFWLRRTGTPVDPELFDLPPLSVPTPTHAPIVAVIDKTARVTGGVSLTPEQPHVESGRQFLALATSLVDDPDAPFGLASTWTAAALAVVVAAVVTALSAWPLSWLAGAGPAGTRLGLVWGLRAWLLTATVHLVFAALFAPVLYSTWFSRFDRDFLAFLITFALGPVVMGWLCERAFRQRCSEPSVSLPGLPPVRLRLLAFVGLVLPISSASIGFALALLTVAATSTTPTPTVERILSSELAGMNTWGMATLSVGESPEDGALKLYPAPASLANVFRPPWTCPSQSFVEAPETFLWEGPKDPFYPVDSLEAIDWPEDLRPERGKHYSPEGVVPN